MYKGTTEQAYEASVRINTYQECKHLRVYTYQECKHLRVNTCMRTYAKIA